MRAVSVWLPSLPIDRLLRRQPGWRDRPCATVAAGSLQRLAAVSGPARTLGLRPGMMVTQARALVPALLLAPADPEGDRRLTAALAERCSAWSPWTAPERPLADADDPALAIPGAGLWLDIEGCAHLFGGEAVLLEEVQAEMKRLGLGVRAAIAASPGAAWALARFGPRANTILPAGGEREALADLPLAALRLPAKVTGQLSALGLRRIGDLLALPRAQLSVRFGREPAWRLDQALGIEPEPIEPLRPPAPHRVRLAFAEPVGRTEDVEEALRRLIATLCTRLEKEGQGLRRAVLLAFRTDGSVAEIAAGTGAPSRDPAHLFRLFEDRIGSLDAGFGIEALRLDAPDIAPLAARQNDMAGGSGLEESFAQLLDNIGNRLGAGRVMRLAPQESHIPERAVRRMAAAAPRQPGEPPAWPPAWQREGRRPVLLLEPPEPVEATALLPDSPPSQFQWRRQTHRVIHADGPERIACEWWKESRPDRDYYRVEDKDGRRLWLYRILEPDHEGKPVWRWFLHGVFP